MKNFNEINKTKSIYYGTSRDVCFICKRKHIEGSKSQEEATIKAKMLEGKYTGKPVLKVPNTDTCICIDCIKEIADDFIIQEDTIDKDSKNKDKKGKDK